jgi:hypothetical protein
MALPTEPIGSVPSSQALQVGMQAAAEGQLSAAELDALFDEAVRDTLRRDHLGTTDDCGFSPFGDDTSTSRDTAFAKIAARVTGTALASSELGA